MSRVGKSIETESRLGLLRAGGWGEILLMDTSFLLGVMEIYMDCSDGCTSLMYILKPLNCTFWFCEL